MTRYPVKPLYQKIFLTNPLERKSTMPDKQFAETDASLEPLSFCQALRSVTEAGPFISDCGLWRLGFFKSRSVIQLGMLSRSTKEGLVIPLFPALRSSCFFDFSYSDKQSNERIVKVDTSLPNVEVFSGTFYDNDSRSLLARLKDTPPNFKLTSGTYTYQTTQYGIHAGGLWPFKGHLRRLLLFHESMNRFEPAEVEWDVDIQENSRSISLQHMTWKKHPWFDKYPLLKSLLFGTSPVFVLQLQLHDGQISASAIWLKKMAYTLDEITNKSETDRKRSEPPKS